MSEWSRVLDSCPGLLCCVINNKGKLLYASHGYKAIASRLFGHKCVEGSNYPPMISDLDKTLHEVLMAAYLGDSNGIELTENNQIWNFTASPLKIDGKKIDGVVIRIISDVTRKNLPPIIQSNPEILNSVPFRAGVIDSNGIFLAANKFLSGEIPDIIGKNIIELVTQETNSGLINLISKRSGNIECNIPVMAGGKNFYDFSEEIYLDEKFNSPDDKKDEILSECFIKIHASPIKWNDKECVMLTFEELTELRKTQEQLRRLLTFDTSTGILNRLGMEHAVIQEFSNAVKTSEPISLIMINIDNFATINETRGYTNANRVLYGFVNIMKRFLVEHGKNIISHWGGDEFMILSHCSGATAVYLANEIRERSITLSMSIGVADLNLGVYAGVNDFISAAYSAMAEAKALGGGQTILARN